MLLLHRSVFLHRLLYNYEAWSNPRKNGIKPPAPVLTGVTFQQVFQVFLGSGKSFLQTKFLAVGSSLGHLSMKKFFRSDLSSWP